VKRQAFIMGYADTFFLLGIALLLALAATVCLRKPDKLGAGGAH
jgi:DHA2 family multidrug resistance protein